MNKLDKIVLGILVLMVVFLVFYGFKISMGYTIAVGGIAIEIGKAGKVFWLGVLGILVIALVLIKARGRR